MTGIYKKYKERAGFTLAEALMVIAIIGVLAAVAVPGIINARKNLKMMELDESARSIFVAAQNRMSGMRSVGAMGELDGAPLSQKPADFDTTGLEWKPDDYVYLSRSSVGIDKLLPAGSIDSTFNEGCFYIEYNKETGMVYSVFYSDKDFTYNTNLPREKSERRKEKPMLGYYGASGTEANDVIVKPLDFRIVNKDYLAVEFPESLAAGYCEYKLTISDGESTAYIDDILSKIFTNGNISNFTDTGTGERWVRVILDSLDTEMQFKKLFGDGGTEIEFGQPHLVPGRDLTITLSAKDTPTNVVLLPATKTVNSLFEKRSDDKAYVAYSRHLQNLHPAFSGIDGDAVVTTAEQTKELDWAEAVAFANSSDRFKSIDNKKLESFDGLGNGIYNLDASLFDNFGGVGNAGETLNRVRLINTKMTAAAEGAPGYIGALVNTASGVSIKNCSVYAKAKTSLITADSCVLYSESALATGGLIGYAEGCVIENSFASLTKINAKSGHAGGFVGSSSGTTFEKCYADTGYWKTEDEGWDENSGIFAASTARSGGFAGTVSSGNIGNSYATGQITGGNAAGFAGAAQDSASFKDSYSAASYALETKPAARGFAGGSGFTATNCFYLKDSLEGGANPGGATGLSYTALADKLPGAAWVAPSLKTTNQYGRGFQEEYPFARLSSLLHYGDWPGEEGSAREGIYYYELYEGGSLGFHARFGDGAVVNTLNNSLDVIEDGYALLLSDDLDESINIQAYIHGDGSNVFGRTKPAGNGVAVQIGDETFYSYYMPPDWLDEFVSGLDKVWILQKYEYYYTVTVEGHSYDGFYFVPYFAKAAINDVDFENGKLGDFIPDKAGQNPKGTVAYMRTARHLKNLADLSLTDAGFTNMVYEQERDIDFETYGDVLGQKLAMTPIAPSDHQFKGVYDGGGNIITGTGINPATGTSRGLFAYVNGGELKNISFVDDGKGRTIAGNGYTGGLVGNLEESVVDNCIVSGFTISGAQAGGLAGRIKGSTVTNSAAVCGYYNVNAGRLIGGGRVNGTSSAGGFMGLDHGSNTIKNCAASGYSVESATAAGGFVGNPTGGSAYENCTASNGYFGTGTAGGQVSSQNTAGGFAGAPGGTMTNCYAIAKFGTGGNVYAFSPNNWGVTFTNCYAAAMQGQTYILNFAPGGTMTNCLVFNGLNRKEITEALSGIGAFGTATAENTFPYDTQLAQLDYLLPAVVKDNRGGGESTVHYGNWPLGYSELIDALFYYELYTDGTYGFYAENVKDDVLPQTINTLRADVPVAEDGYAMLCLGERPIPTLEFDLLRDRNGASALISEHAISKTAVPNGSSAVWADLPGDTPVNAYLVSPQVLPSIANANIGADYYIGLRIKGMQWKYIFNPYFAQTALNTVRNFPGDISVASLSGNISTRTARHISNLAKLTGASSSPYASKSYLQGREIDFSAYTGENVTMTSPISSGAAFSGRYNGGYNVITGTGISVPANSSNPAGLFAKVNGGTLENMVFTSDINEPNRKTARKITGGTGSTGVLVGEVTNGTIRNCAVAGFEVTGSGFVGGFVGRLISGTIENCSAVNGYFGDVTAVGGEMKGAGNSIAGFVADNNGTIKSSYAMSSFATSINSPKPFTANTVNKGTVTDCYAAAVKGYDKDSFIVTHAAGEADANCYKYNGSRASAARINNEHQAGVWGRATGANSFPYDPELFGTELAFPAVVKGADGSFVHYGNWPNRAMRYVQVAYYEIYDVSSGANFGIYSEQLGMDFLRDDVKVLQDGYMMLYQTGGRNNFEDVNINHVGDPGNTASFHEISILTKDGRAISLGNNGGVNLAKYKPNDSNNYNKYYYWDGTKSVEMKSSNTTVLEYNGVEYSLYLLPMEAMAPNAYPGVGNDFGTDYFTGYRLTNSTNGTATFWLNPYVAKSETVRSGEHLEGPHLPEQEGEKLVISIRSERQYASITQLLNIYDTATMPFWDESLYIFKEERALVFGNNNPYIKTYTGTSLTSGTYAPYRDPGSDRKLKNQSNYQSK